MLRASDPKAGTVAARDRSRDTQVVTKALGSDTRASTDAGLRRAEATRLLIANLANPRIVGRSVVAITGLKHLLLLGGVYAQLRATGAMRGPAFMRREVSWPRSAAPCCSPQAGRADC